MKRRTTGPPFPTTLDELLRYSEEHLAYEIRMLRETGTVLLADTYCGVVKDALIESFATHVKNLGIFLYPGAGSPKQGEDVTANQYVEVHAIWSRLRSKIS